MSRLPLRTSIAPQVTMTQTPPKVTSWLEDLEDDLWGSKDESGNGESDGTARGAEIGGGLQDIGERNSTTSIPIEDGTENALSATADVPQKPSDAGSLAMDQPKMVPGPVESDPVA